MSEAPNIQPVSETRIGEIAQVSGQSTQSTAKLVRRGAEVMEALKDAPDSKPRRSNARPVQ